MNATEDASAFLRRVEPLLAADPVANNVMLSLLHQRVAVHQPGRYWPVEHDGELVGAIFHSPASYPALITALPRAAVAGAVRLVADEGLPLPGVSGDAATAARFAGEWTEQTRTAAVPTLAQRIYEVDAVIPPATPSGRAREATVADREAVIDWFRAFVAEIGDPPSDPSSLVDHRIATGQVSIWEDGAPMAFAALTGPVQGVVRVGPVYTAPEGRGRGYASALVADLSARILADGSRCILYADLNNATSNAIYRAIGYRAVEECLRYRFDG